MDILRHRLSEFGWIEGHDVAYELLWAENDYGRYPHMVRELIRRRVDVIVAPSADAALAAQQATATIPIVMVWALEPIRLGLIRSYARPGGNVTGLTTEAGYTIVEKYVDLLVQALPGLKRVAVLWNATSRVQRDVLGDMHDAARTHGISVLGVAVRARHDFETAFSRMAEEHAGALLILADPLFYTHRARLAELARAHRLPAMSSVADFVESGGLMRYIVAHHELWRRSAAYVDRVLRGVDPATLPVEQPRTFELVIHLGTARAIGLELPPAILVRADKVIDP